MKLVLFDIDGTILLTDGAGRRAVHRALLDVFGSVGPPEHRFDGKTDPQIVRESMRLAGHEDTLIEARMACLLDHYLAYFDEELAAARDRIHVFPGARELIEALAARHDVLLGLVTGNLAAGARAKLAAAGIDPDRFKVGAFGSDHERRDELPAIAQRRARESCGVDVSGGDVVVIGDTPADLACGRAIGARAIGVATGHYSVEALVAQAPAAVFENLSDTESVMRAIMGNGE